ncbi:hypothetical protein TRV_07062 [Trichophyton verrucosum HKI 0517]|uniref:Uncharacterized protein n=1 Tax=Trichophyton verrucosum (strain HKI 0517) TaxID=663202 RepID=D4DIQ2_TRIVH|nr:uncharacterized protein TRV_07062 [Trichophyton verrucosum HKI 0517]EFE38285.1 hypothetical protein TRV_07062 [Trichophyton verrucosum HKI 0517]
MPQSGILELLFIEQTLQRENGDRRRQLLLSLGRRREPAKSVSHDHLGCLSKHVTVSPHSFRPWHVVRSASEKAAHRGHGEQKQKKAEAGGVKEAAAAGEGRKAAERERERDGEELLTSIGSVKAAFYFFSVNFNFNFNFSYSPPPPLSPAPRSALCLFISFFSLPLSSPCFFFTRPVSLFLRVSVFPSCVLSFCSFVSYFFLSVLLSLLTLSSLLFSLLSLGSLYISLSPRPVF